MGYEKGSDLRCFSRHDRTDRHDRRSKHDRTDMPPQAVVTRGARAAGAQQLPGLHSRMTADSDSDSDSDSDGEDNDLGSGGVGEHGQVRRE
ncbi:uncharacterized protein EKO05_0010465 [Ascochyta rabiei]|uniref:uncharacterized protein n=1 Tax=Didymella rabiei TaxID=5454 RepID=UPI0022099009|nr:uncharacterized protein EKO05_0010465 [Ascochyta rabiei]UPX20225.1 hypothetical protein EKO05_0010465 [Ascochyta rabiei]